MTLGDIFANDARYADYVGIGQEPRMTGRKVRLFVCACCRRGWDRLNTASRTAIEVAERYADGQASADDVLASLYIQDKTGGIGVTATQWGLILDSDELTRMIPNFFPLIVQTLTSSESQFLDTTKWGVEYPALVDLFFDIFRSRFPQPIRIDPDWQRTTHPVRKLAESIYESRSFADLPILADALEEAGCTDQAMLEHCRGNGAHARGCWVVDHLLGRG